MCELFVTIYISVIRIASVNNCCFEITSYFKHNQLTFGLFLIDKYVGSLFLNLELIIDGFVFYS